MEEEERGYWRDRIFKVLKAAYGYENCSLEKCLDELKSHPLNRAAAVAAFWNVYLKDEKYRKLSDEQLNRINELLKFTGSNLSDESEKGLREAKALVVEHLAGTVLVSELASIPINESPSSIKAINIGIVACPLTELFEVEDGNYWTNEHFNTEFFHYSDALVSGVIFSEAALLRYYERKYEEALHLTCNGLFNLRIATKQDSYVVMRAVNKMMALEKGTPEKETPEDLRGLTPYLPHSGEWFDEQEAANIFEAIKVHHHDIKEWDEVAAHCESILRYDFDETLLNFYIKDNEGNEILGADYWNRAAAFAQCQLSPDAYLTLMAEKDKQEAETRLRKDFFEDSWVKLDKKTRDYLIEAEGHWEKNEFKDMLDDYRQAMECELSAMFPLLKSAFQKDDYLALKQMAFEMTNNDMIRQTITKRLRRQQEQNFILKDIPSFAVKLGDTRNDFVHPKREGPNPDINKAKSLRKQLLGIDQKGVMPYLAWLKQLL